MTDKFDHVRRILADAVDVDLPPGLRADSEPPAAPRVAQQGHSLKPRAQHLLGQLVYAGNIEPILERRYVVKGWIDQGSLSMIFGSSNSGKSFLAVDLAHHISKGLPWGGHRVNRGRVLYLAAEGGAAFVNRIAALDQPELWVAACPITFTSAGSQVEPLAEVVKHLEAIGGGPFSFIVVDTLSRVMGGADENAAPDIADLIRNLDQLRQETGAHVMVIHHTGKDANRGARGHSALRAAIDTEIELTRDDFGVITAEVTKQRDGPTGGRFNYTLRQVELGLDQDGEPVTTCVVEPADTGATGGQALTPAGRAALNLLEALLTLHGEIVRDPKYPGSPCIGADRWREACLEPGAISVAEKRESRARTFLRCQEELQQRRLIAVKDTFVWRLE